MGFFDISRPRRPRGAGDTLWFRDGKLLVDENGLLYLCPDCPCDGPSPVVGTLYPTNGTFGWVGMNYAYFGEIGSCPFFEKKNYNVLGPPGSWYKRVGPYMLYAEEFGETDFYEVCAPDNTGAEVSIYRYDHDASTWTHICDTPSDATRVLKYTDNARFMVLSDDEWDDNFIIYALRGYGGGPAPKLEIYEHTGGSLALLQEATPVSENYAAVGAAPHFFSSGQGSCFYIRPGFTGAGLYYYSQFISIPSNSELPKNPTSGWDVLWIWPVGWRGVDVRDGYIYVPLYALNHIGGGDDRYGLCVVRYNVATATWEECDSYWQGSSGPTLQGIWVDADGWWAAWVDEDGGAHYLVKNSFSTRYTFPAIFNEKPTGIHYMVGTKEHILLQGEFYVDPCPYTTSSAFLVFEKATETFCADPLIERSCGNSGGVVFSSRVT